MSSYADIMDSLLYYPVVNLYLVCVNKRYFILRRGVLSRYGITPRIRLLLHTYNFVVYREPHLTGPFECAVYARKRPIGQAPLYRRGAI